MLQPAETSHSTIHRTAVGILGPPLPDIPPDILEKILHTLIETFNDGECSNRLQQLISVSHISSSWRQIAFDCPTLWSKTLYFGDPNQARFDKVLALTQQAPLTVKAAFGHFPTANTPVTHFEQILQLWAQMHRLRSIEFTFCDMPDRAMLIDALESRPTDELHSLILRTKPAYGSRWDLRTQVGRLPWHGSGYRFPPKNLRLLHLNMCNLSPNSADIKQVESLTIIERDREAWTADKLFQWWSKIFSPLKMPALQHLKLGHFDKAPPVEYLNELHRNGDCSWTLPAGLKSFEISGYAEVVALLCETIPLSSLPLLELCSNITINVSVWSLTKPSMISALLGFWDNTLPCSYFKIKISYARLQVVRKAPDGRSVSVDFEFTQATASLQQDVLVYLSLPENSPNLLPDAWMELDVGVLKDTRSNGDRAHGQQRPHELHPLFIDFFRNLRITNFYLIMHTVPPKWNWMMNGVPVPDSPWINMFQTQIDESDEFLLPTSIEHIRIHHLLLTESDFVEDFIAYDAERVRCGCAIKIVECVSQDGDRVVLSGGAKSGAF